MERRGFIKGILTSIAGTAAMVTLAKPREAAALVAHRELLLAQPAPSPWNASRAIMGDPEVYAQIDGKFVSIGFIQSMQIHAEVDELISWDGEIRGTNSEYIMGMKRISMTFGGPIR